MSQGRQKVSLCGNGLKSVLFSFICYKFFSWGDGSATHWQILGWWRKKKVSYKNDYICHIMLINNSPKLFIYTNKGHILSNGNNSIKPIICTCKYMYSIALENMFFLSSSLNCFRFGSGIKFCHVFETHGHLFWVNEKIVQGQLEEPMWSWPMAYPNENFKRAHLLMRENNCSKLFLNPSTNIKVMVWTNLHEKTNTWMNIHQNATVMTVSHSQQAGSTVNGRVKL